MKKSVYSIVLSDHVVEAVDRMAALKGISRSALINSILASQLDCTTPEMQRQSVFSVVEQQMKDIFRIKAGTSDAMLFMYGTLRYKYCPSLRYSVELFREPDGDVIGKLSVSCRTKSTVLIEAMDEFFRLIIALELNACKTLSEIEGMYELTSGRMTRCILRGNCSSDEIGESISLYISCFDKVMQEHFAAMQCGLPGSLAAEMTVNSYSKVLQKYGMII